jgi:hypothetical protein
MVFSWTRENREDANATLFKNLGEAVKRGARDVTLEDEDEESEEDEEDGDEEDEEEEDVDGSSHKAVCARE